MKMQRKRHRIQHLLSVIICFVMLSCLAVGSSYSAMAETTNEAVTRVNNSLMQVRMVYDLNGSVIPIQGGTGFLINSNTILTCAHVVDVDTETKEALVAVAGKDYSEDKISLQVVVSGDVTITATIKKESQENDFAILNLTEAIYDREVVALGDSDDVTATQMVYALGFPASVSEIQNKNTYTRNDVTITDGKVSKLINVSGTDMIQHGATLTSGNSGGPLVDENGTVIGINNATKSDYNYAICINQVTDILKALGIEYTSGSTSDSNINNDTSATTAETVAPVTQQPETIAPATQSVTEDTNTTETDNGMDTTKIIIIAAILVVVVVLVIVIIFIIMGNKKKSTKKIASNNVQTAVRPAQPIPGSMAHQNVPNAQNRGPVVVSRQTPPTSPAYNQPDDGTDSTTVLNEGAGKTSVLGLQSTGATLLRKGNGERIKIDKPSFIIGKERRRVDYCVADNSSVSRTHAKITCRAGKYYISDLGSLNFTYVNGAKLNPNQEIALNKGDKIKISDEEFEFLC